MQIINSDNNKMVIVQQESKTSFIAIAVCFFLLAFLVLISGNIASFMGFLLGFPSIILGIVILFAVPRRKIEVDLLKKSININNKMFFIEKNSEILFKQIKKVCISNQNKNDTVIYSIQIYFKNNSEFLLLQDIDINLIKEIEKYINHNLN